ncbi:MAG: hypothetical protein UY52_C0009G0036 [Parcubacteria group bacterium GW2011_GWC2_49_9]|nr:MAG: hypothetical protein UY34_C0011G0021 [Parcubacteria group bacterium GW2011_GWA2_48_9]KKW16176.1 MAG: hypothetical protein UY52_C0009G0036 [Parcubacteria group bacterium GW2011_GWC2_49_9]
MTVIAKISHWEYVACCLETKYEKLLNFRKEAHLTHNYK